MFSKVSTHMAVHIYNGIFGFLYLGIISYTILIIRSVLIFLNLVSYYKDIYHDKATAFFCEYLLKCAFPCDLLGMWICYIYLWYTNARQTAKLLWCFLDSVLKAECGIRIKQMNIIIDVTLLNKMNPDVGYRTFFLAIYGIFSTSVLPSHVYNVKSCIHTIQT